MALKWHIVQKERSKRKGSPFKRDVWTEYQVKKGNSVLARAATYNDAKYLLSLYLKDEARAVDDDAALEASVIDSYDY